MRTSDVDGHNCPYGCTRACLHADQCLLQADRQAHSALSLHFVFYIFFATGMPPMVTVLSHTVQDMEWIVSLVDAQEAPQKKWAPFQKEPVPQFQAERRPET
jgi:hypothetical protein